MHYSFWISIAINEETLLQMQKYILIFAIHSGSNFLVITTSMVNIKQGQTRFHHDTMGNARVFTRLYPMHSLKVDWWFLHRAVSLLCQMQSRCGLICLVSSNIVWSPWKISYPQDNDWRACFSESEITSVCIKTMIKEHISMNQRPPLCINILNEMSACSCSTLI